MKKIIVVLLISVMLVSCLFACKTDTPAETTGAVITDGSTQTPATDSPVTTVPADTTAAADPDTTKAPGEATDSSPASTQAPETNAPETKAPETKAPETRAPDTTPEVTTPPATSTVPVTTEPAEDFGPVDPNYVTFDSSKIISCMTGANQCKATTVKNGSDGYMLKLTTTKSGNDPYIFFNYKSYMSKYKLTPVSANEYKYVVMKVRCENCSNSDFELFYCAGSVTGAAAGSSKATVFNNAITDWQYIYWDLTNATSWKGAVNGFRFDFMKSCAGADESMYIASVFFTKTYDEVKNLVSSGSSESGLTAEQQKKVDELLKVKDAAPAVSNTKQTAANEDSSVNLWFDHTYTKTPAESVKSSGMNTYQMRLAKNEIEGCQFLLAAASDKKGLTAELTEFKNQSGNTLKSGIFYGYYLGTNDISIDDKIDGMTIADPIPPLTGAFDLTANKSKLFLIKVWSSADTPAGQYSATLIIKDADGKEIKKAIVYAYIWDFELPAASSCKTLADLSWWNIYASHGAYDSAYYNGDDSATYKRYYDFMLENKICCYTLPYSTEGKFDDSRIKQYLDDPRVVAFNPVGWKIDISNGNIASSYNYLSQKAEWLNKAYFYTVDEPMNKTMLDKVISDTKLIKSVYKDDYKVIVPMHLNTALDSASKVDYFEYVKDYLNIWCPHTFFFNSFAEYSTNHSLTYRSTAMLEKNLGTFKARMAEEQAKGKEVWWYVTRYPESPEITLTIDTTAVNYRILFWQQKLYNVDGFLYYSVNDWVEGQSKNNGYNSKHETSNDSYTPYDVYGNGVLVYCGARAGVEGGPVGSLRLECVRDGIEDYDYLTLLAKIYGKETVDCLIKQITTSLGEYKSDEVLFTQLRIALGNLLDAQ